MLKTNSKQSEMFSSPSYSKLEFKLDVEVGYIMIIPIIRECIIMFLSLAKRGEKYKMIIEA